MSSVKSDIRKKFILLRKKNSLKKKIFNFHLIFKLIKKYYLNKKITIAGYFPSNYEVDILMLLKLASKKRFKITLPVIKKGNSMTFKRWSDMDPLYVNNYGILEPNSKNKNMIPDLILVPLVAFDKRLNRIGYGKGYYDRALKKIKKIKKKMITIGVAYSFQECNKVPVNKYDYKLDYIFTERGIISSKY